MAGNIGSPLCAELNRIANNGVYPDRDDFLEEQGAANVWAGTTGQGLLGALNYIVDPTRTDNNYKGLTAVCNELAGTTGLSDVDALRTIGHAAEVLLRGTTPQSAVFTTDAATPRYNYPGYLTMSGVDGDYISTPDAAALDITGAIDLQIKVMLPVVPPVKATTNLIQKGTTNNLSYTLFIDNSGYLGVLMSSSGTAWDVSAYSTAIVPFPANTAKWVRATFTPNNGSGSRETKFFTSDDGSTWTQLGATVTGASMSNIFSGNTQVGIAGSSTGTTSLLGRFYRAIIKNGIDGTTVLDVNAETNVTSATYDQFTATTGQLCTINGQNTLTNAGKAGALLPITVGSSLAADSNDAKFLDHTGTNYVYLPGTSSNFLNVPNSAPLQITGDLDVRANVAFDNWNPGVFMSIVQKDLSYELLVTNAGRLFFRISTSGAGWTQNITSTVSPTVSSGQSLWVRATLDADNGASGNDVRFFTSPDGTTWTQLGTTVTTAGTVTLATNTNGVLLLTSSAGANPGKLYDAQIFSDITGTTKVLDVDTSVITTGAATSFTALTGQTVTINRSTSGRKTVAVTQPTWLFGTDDYMEVNNRYMAHSTSDENYVYLSGVTGNNMTVADSPPLDVTSDIDIQVKVALDDWTPSGTQRLVSKYSTSDNQRSYSLYVTSTGYLELAWSNNGTTAITKTSTVTPTVTDGGTLWVRATLDIDNGAAGNDVKFFTSTDGTTWTQLGSTVTTAGTTSVYSGSATLFIGDYSQVNQSAKGKFYRAIIKNGIDGTTVLDANAAVITLPSQTTFTDSSSNAYTVTINKSGVGTFVSTGNYLYLPGIATNYATAPDSAALSITGDLDLRVKVSLDDWTPTGAANILAKAQTLSTLSYQLGVSSTGALNFLASTNGSAWGTNATSTAVTGFADGATKWIRVTFDVDNGAAGRDVKFFTSDDGLTWTQLGSTVTTAGTFSIIDTTSQLEIGASVAGSNFPTRGKFFRAQVLNGIGGTVAFDANFENSITSLNQASFTESSSNAATVTINRSGSTYRSAGVIDAGYLYPGATNTFSNSTIDYLNFGANQDFTVLAVARQFGSTAGNGEIISKNFNYGSSAVNGYNLVIASGFTQNFFTTVGAGTYYYSNSTNVSAGNAFLLSMVRSGATVVSYNNANAVGTGAFAGTLSASLANFQTLRIGTSNQNAQFFAGEVYAAAVFRSVLTPKNIADIYNYFNGRD